ncbi:TcdA/TcdB catalytic glycosyltransferase domain-containing protein [Paraburkholderia aromaticivorans]|uniref:Glycosyltransferase n=1 Tax=Paraburkholderia aromaticivorans TaxID=2026199 RepID=A0A248VX33_9BURK|nr:TcdA/TcdB catalytic glycosyltransferase domain-containing protein [Paraburkholderia aromaticivorans]ASW03527.1 glycosyltransferase [Paraburkholderia aromaticivorans]
MRAIPKVIHIIWLGGDIPRCNRDCIVTFPRLNPNWEVNLWIDANQLLTGERRRQIAAHYTNATTPKVTPERWKEVADTLGKQGGDAATIKYLDQYLNQRGEALQGMRVQQINSIMNFCNANGIRLREVQRDLRMGRNAAIYRKELVNRGGNFGSASDILRIEILLQHGGIYADTDVSCVSPLGDIICHQSYPRFSAVSIAWHRGITTQNWLSDDWWRNNIRTDQQPAISNSIIAAHAGSSGLKSYKSLIHRNFKALKSKEELRQQYMHDVRGSTIKMTGPSAAAESSGFKKVRDTMAESQMASQDADQKLRDSLFMRDNWYFPMNTVRDAYFHDWL